MLVVSGDATPLWTSPATCAHLRSGTSSRSTARRRRSAAAVSHAHAIRHGSRIARSPPGRRTARSVPGAAEATHISDQQLAAPDRAVGAVAAAVEDRADGGARLAVLGEARREVRVMVLHPDQLDAVALERVLGRQVLRMQVVGHDLGRDREQPLEVLDPLGERRKRLVVLEVADVVAHPGAAATRQAERVLQLGAAGRARGARCRRAASAQRARTRASAARTAAAGSPPLAQPSRRCGSRSGGRGRAAGRRSRPAAATRVLVAVGDRLVGHVAAGHHERAGAEVAQQQVVKRRVREHHAKLARRRGQPTGRPGASGRRGASTIGRCGPLSSVRSASPEIARALRLAERPATISANGLSSRCLRARSAPTAASSSARQARWYPPIPLTATIAPPRSASTAAAERGVRAERPRGPRIEQRQRRPAAGAGVGLGVEAPVARVLVLGAAVGAHLKAGHRRQRAVVGDAAHDREPRTAVGAVDERVAVAAVGRVEQLAQAVGAGRAVRRDRRVGALAARARDGSRSRRSPVGSRGSTTVTRSTTASGGASGPSRARNALDRRRVAPSISSSTPRESLSTNPASPSSPASR